LREAHSGEVTGEGRIESNLVEDIGDWMDERFYVIDLDRGPGEFNLGDKAGVEDMDVVDTPVTRWRGLA